MGTGRVVYFLDSDVLFDIQRGNPVCMDWLKENQGELIALPTTVAMELLIGSRDKEELARSRGFLQMFRVAWMNEVESELALKLLDKYCLPSGPSLPDFQIAAQAVNRGATLLTFNMKHFGRIKELDARAPYSR